MLYQLVVEGSRRLEGGIYSGVDILEDPLSLFLVQATIIYGACRGLSLLGAYLKQPTVTFEIIGGILLGPSALGRDEKYLEKIFPASSLSKLSIVANVGLVFYLFLVGMELDVNVLKMHASKAWAISFFGVAIPFCCGIAISRVMFDQLQAGEKGFEDVSFVSFFVFIGTAMSITAFPGKFHPIAWHFIVLRLTEL